MATRIRWNKLVAVVLGLSLAAAPAAAQPKLLVNVNNAGRYVYGGLHYGGGQWATMTSQLDQVFTGGVTTVNTLSDLSMMLTFDALWVDQRYQATASQTEIDNILSYAATGRRVVVMGENATWGGWNGQVLDALGGIEGPLNGYGVFDEGSPSGGLTGAGCLNGRDMAVGTSTLVDHVALIGLTCGGYAIGGTPLFAYNVATLWGDTKNVLTILDTNIFDDVFVRYDGRQFGSNVANWLGASQPTPSAAPSVAPMMFSARFARSPLPMVTSDDQVFDLQAQVVTPEPSTMALAVTGLAALALVRRRARRD